MALVDGDKRCGCGAGHQTFGACMRAKSLIVQLPEQHRAVQSWDTRLSDFAKCVTSGVEPKSTQRTHVNEALRVLHRRG